MTQNSNHNKDRLRRADSWLKLSQTVDSDDERFIFLWIAFNAAYGAELWHKDLEILTDTERNKVRKFLAEILLRDHEENMKNILFDEKFFSNAVRKLIQNEYVYEPYWQWVRDEQNDEPWEKAQFNKDNQRVFNSFEKRDARTVIEEVLRRLYTLRNQILHGGTTFAKGKGRDQLKDGSEIMAKLVPVIVEIMRTDIENNPDSDVWGRVAYPLHNC